MSELKDCPFCGNEGETEAIVGGQCWGVGCTNCDYQLMSGPVGIGWFRTEAEAIAAWNTRALTRSEVPAGRLSADDVAWVTNDLAELGVRIGDQFFFCYKGSSLVYEDAKHDDGSPMYWRPVFKREFGECIHPINYEDLQKCGRLHSIGTVSLDDSDNWQPLPSSSTDSRGAE